MTYDEDLADRIREAIADEPDVTETRMFGGLAFLVGGSVAVGVSGRGGLKVRVDPVQTDALLAKPHAATFEMGGRALQGLATSRCRRRAYKASARAVGL